MKIAMYPGTFNPVTNGHLTLVENALNIFDRVIVAVGNNESKQCIFSSSERMDLCEKVFAPYDRVSVKSLDGLLVDFAREHNAPVVIRGIRNYIDWEYEYQMAEANRELYSELEYVFLLPSKKSSFISSSLVREIAKLGGDLHKFVPNIVVKALELKNTSAF